MENSAKNQMAFIVATALADHTRLAMIDILQNGPITVADLSNRVGESVEEHLAMLKNAGLLLGDIHSQEPISLSPFGVYGARKILDEVLATTHEDGQCAGCKGCS
ncbi:MAG: winged helix-turn-helix transcriptional regulator [Clostridia bacterium]|nr:winged helix-turn-helix transcriptional regulator [Clostridia bacterium]